MEDKILIILMCKEVMHHVAVKHHVAVMHHVPADRATSVMPHDGDSVSLGAHHPVPLDVLDGGLEVSVRVRAIIRDL